MAYMLVLIDTRDDSVAHRVIRNDPLKADKAMGDFIDSKYGPRPKKARCFN